MGGATRSAQTNTPHNTRARAHTHTHTHTQPNPELHMDLSDSFPDLSHNEEGPPPTNEEQQQMALFWAKEEAQVGVASSPWMQLMYDILPHGSLSS